MSLVRGHPPDGCYFLNCSKSDGEKHSQVAYYSTVKDGGNDGEQPNDSVIIDIVPNEGFITWEGSPQTFTFSNGTKLTLNIEGDAQSKPNFALVGTASNNFGSQWNVYKDAQRTLFVDGQGFQCETIYWCF